MNPERPGVDLITELRFALAEADDQAPEDDFRNRLLREAMSRRAPGTSVAEPARISGVEVLRRTGESLRGLLDVLADDEWTRITVRGLTVAGLVGHLTAVEAAFAAVLEGDRSAADADHVSSTQAEAERHAQFAPLQSRAAWGAGIERTLQMLEDEPDPGRTLRFHGVELDLDRLLIVRAFELWTHAEDIRRATGRPLADPDPSTLARMTALATELLPVGIAQLERSQVNASARLVLTGAGGGVWDVPLDGAGVQRAALGRDCAAHIVVDGVAFCRVVANRSDLAGSGAVVTTGDDTAGRSSGDDTAGLSSGDDVAARVFAGAAALALD